MSQLHKRLSTDQVKIILNLYLMKKMELNEVIRQFEIKERQFYNLLAKYRKDKPGFLIEYPRNTTNNRLPLEVDKVVRSELEKEKTIIENKDIPVSNYNYSAVKDEVIKIINQNISVPTIINRARSWSFYLFEKPRKKSLR